MLQCKFLGVLALCAAIILAQASAPGLAGDWEGTLDTGAGKLRLTPHVTKTDDGLYLGKLVSLDQGNAEVPAGKATVNGRSVALEFPLVDGIFKGEMSGDGSQLVRTWTQGGPLPLTFKRTGKAPASEPAQPPAAAAPSPFGAPVEVAIPAPPIPFRGAGGQSRLIYELHITDFSRETQDLSRIEVFVDTGSMASFDGKELLDTLMQPGIESDDARKIGPGLRAVAFLSVPCGMAWRPANCVIA